MHVLHDMHMHVHDRHMYVLSPTFFALLCLLQGAEGGVMPEGGGKPQLQLLHNITGSFRPGVLTALMGVSGGLLLLLCNPAS